MDPAGANRAPNSCECIFFAAKYQMNGHPWERIVVPLAMEYNCFLATPIFQLLCVHETFLHVNQNSIKQTFNEFWGCTMGKKSTRWILSTWKHWKLRMARKTGRCENIKRVWLCAIYILHALGDVNPQRWSGCHSHRHCSPHPPFSREEFQEAKLLHGSTWCRSHKESVRM